MDDFELGTPRKEDVLFKGDREAWRSDAMLDFPPDGDIYRAGYRRAGRILAEYVDGHGEADFLVFPICHAYRHFVELSLKGLMLSALRLLERDLTEKEHRLQNGSHNLQELWSAFKPMNLEVQASTGIEPPPLEQLEGIEAYIAQLHAVDKGSFSFRYPLTKDGAVNLAGIDRINVRNFSDCMELLCGYLDGWDSYFADMISTANEISTEY